MSSTGQQEKVDEKIASMVFSKIYPLYLAKIEKKGRTAQELNQMISWLTGYNDIELEIHIAGSATMAAFFCGATINPSAQLITGKICGQKVEGITTPITQQVRYLDKLVDELAKGWAMEKILRDS